MATTVDYLPFAVGIGNDVTSQAEYNLATWRTTGFISGILPHEYLNKALRQSSVVSAAIAQTVADLLQTDMLDDGNVASIVNKLKLAFSASLPYDPEATYPPGSIGDMLNTINTSGGAGVNADLLRSLLVDGLNEDQFTVSLKNRLNQIDTPVTGLVATTASLVTTYGSTAAAATSAATASAARADAITAQNAAAISAGAALTSATNASGSATTASTAASNAAVSASTAVSASSSAAGAASTAGSLATTATNAASAAAGSASTAATAATNASSSAGTAGTAASTATTQASNAASSAGTATTAATNAATSSTNAAGSASSANTSAINAANSATTAGNSATAAAGSATTASTHATNAGTSATAASSSATAAQTAQSGASTSASQASTSATNAAGSASSANTSAVAAATASSNAGTSATAANTSAGNASASASSAGNNATAAASWYNSTVAATGSLTAQVTSVSNAYVAADNALSNRLTVTEANYLLKVAATRTDGRQVIGGIGIASTAIGNIGQSEILLQADKLVFVPSSDPNAPLTNLLVVQDVNGVATLFVPQALIPELTAAKITTGTLHGVSVSSSSFVTVGTYLTSLPPLNAPNVFVNSTQDFPSSGTARVLDTLINQTAFNYTGKTATSFTGCTGVVGNLSIGAMVMPAVPSIAISKQLNAIRIAGPDGSAFVNNQLAYIGNNDLSWGAVATFGTNSVGSTLNGVVGLSRSNVAVQGVSTNGLGGYFISDSSHASRSDSQSGVGALASSNTNNAVQGTSSSAYGVFGVSTSGPGVGGVSNSGDGVVGTSTSGHGGVFSGNTNRGPLRLNPLAGRPANRAVGSVAVIYTTGGTIDNRSVNPRLFLADGSSWRRAGDGVIFDG